MVMTKKALILGSGNCPHTMQAWDLNNQRIVSLSALHLWNRHFAEYSFHSL